MKDFIKWLGVSESAAKAGVWLMIIMICLIVVNTCLESVGLPYYAITYDNLKNININEIFNIVSSIIVCLLNFFTVILLVFRTKEFKHIFKYSILYLILNYLISETLGYVAVQIYLTAFYLLFCYIYSNKNKKYILYGVLSIIINVVIQGLTYTYRMKFIEFSTVSEVTRIILSIDYFIIMGIIILVKEIYLKKRGVKNERISRESTMVRRIQKRRNSSKENSEKSS